MKQYLIRRYAPHHAVAPHAGAWIETWTRSRPKNLCVVAPHAGAWIETPPAVIQGGMYNSVAPHAGAWIETSTVFRAFANGDAVAPHAGAWIETGVLDETALLERGVAPHAGAWIETFCLLFDSIVITKSHPTRVRGLKLGDAYIKVEGQSRTPRGCVD